MHCVYTLHASSFIWCFVLMGKYLNGIVCVFVCWQWRIASDKRGRKENPAKRKLNAGYVRLKWDDGDALLAGWLPAWLTGRRGRFHLFCRAVSVFCIRSTARAPSTRSYNFCHSFGHILRSQCDNNRTRYSSAQQISCNLFVCSVKRRHTISQGSDIYLPSIFLILHQSSASFIYKFFFFFLFYSFFPPLFLLLPHLILLLLFLIFSP